MNSVKTNYLVELSEVELVSTIEFSYLLFMLMFLVASMTTINSQKIKKACGDSVLDIVLNKPTTFMKLVSESNCATETVEKYLKKYLTDNKIFQKKGKFRILFSPKITSLEIEFYELMLNPTIRVIVLVLLKSQTLSQSELVASTDKSNSSISRALKILMKNKIISRHYNAPYNTYEIINKSKLHSILEITNPSIATNFD